MNDSKIYHDRLTYFAEETIALKSAALVSSGKNPYKISSALTSKSLFGLLLSLMSYKLYWKCFAWD